MASATEILIDNLNALLAARGWSRSQLAEHAGVEQTTLNRVMNAKTDPHSPGLNFLETLANGLGMTVADLLAPSASALSGETLGERVRSARALRAMTLAQVGSAVGVTPQAIRAIETGETKDVMGRTAFLLADALGVEARWLVTGEGAAISGDAAPPGLATAKRLAANLMALPPDRLEGLSVALGIRL